MKTSDLLNLSPYQIGKMSEKELRKVVSTIRSTARKRWERLERKGLYSPAMKAFSKKAKGFDTVLPSVKDMDMITLRNEYRRYKLFLEAQTSTVPGAKKAMEQQTKLVNELAGRSDLSPSEASEILSMADDLKLADEIARIQSSTKRISAITEEYNTGKSKEEIMQDARKRLEEAYENRVNAISTSEYFNQNPGGGQ